MSDLFNGETSQNIGANQWLSSTTSAATQPEFCAASKSKYSEWHLSTHSCKGSQCVGQLWENFSLSKGIVWHLAGVKDANLNQKTQTWIRQRSPKSSAALQPVQILWYPVQASTAHSSLARAKASRNQGWQQGLICQSRRGKTGLLAKASNKALLGCLRRPCHVGWASIAL